jgi:hypothetical protein
MQVSWSLVLTFAVGGCQHTDCTLTQKESPRDEVAKITDVQSQLLYVGRGYEPHTVTCDYR